MNRFERRKRRQLDRSERNANVHLGTNKFHIYAKYRFPELKSKGQNIVRVDIRKHAAYHEIFGLRTPEEVLRYLNDYFWGNLFILEIKEGKENSDGR